MSNNLPPNLPRLKAGWSWVKLGDISEPPQYGYTTSASNDGNLKFLRTTDITAGHINWDSVPYCKVNPKEVEKYLLKENDVVISRAGSVGYSFLLSKPERAVFASYLIRFRPKTNSKFFALFLQSPHYWNQISEKKLGIAVPNVNATKLKDINFPLPPLPEQKKIVEKIEELFSGLDSGVASLKKAKEQIKLYRQSVLASAFNGKLSGNGNIDEKTELPKDWKSLPLKNIVVSDKGGLKRGPFGSSIKKSFFVESGYKVYEQGNAINDDPYRGKYFINEEKYKELEAFKVLPGDLIVSCSGVTLGRITEIPDDAIPGVINQALLRIRLNKEFILTKYFITLFRSHFFQKRIFQKSQGSAMPNLVGLKDFKEIDIIVPPVHQQTQIVEEIEKRFSEADNLEKAIDDSLEKSEALRQSILKKAFEGKLV